MASAWGDSWGDAWGISWGGDAPVDTSVRDRWANVIRLNTSHGRIATTIDAARLVATIEADRLDALAAGNRSETQADHGRIE
jgi:hypothetical protein